MPHSWEISPVSALMGHAEYRKKKQHEMEEWNDSNIRNNKVWWHVLKIIQKYYKKWTYEKMNIMKLNKISIVDEQKIDSNLKLVNKMERKDV